MKVRLTQQELDEFRDRAENGYGIPGMVGSYDLMRLLNLIEEFQIAGRAVMEHIGNDHMATCDTWNAEVSIGEEPQPCNCGVDQLKAVIGGGE